MSANLVEVGKIVRLHGFRGAFVMRCETGKESVLSSVATLAIGATPEQAIRYTIEEASWMPKGWKVKLEKLDSEDEAKLLINKSVYVPREDFPALPAGEYYVADLVGCKVLDFESKKPLGVLDRVDLNNFGHQWWVVKSGEDEYFVPNKKSFIQVVDLKNRIIEVTLPHEDGEVDDA